MKIAIVSMTLDTTPPLFRVLPELEKIEGMLAGARADVSEWCDVSADSRLDDWYQLNCMKF